MKAVVCGGGIAGLAIANRLAETGWEVTLLEQAPGPRTTGYMIDFFGIGYDAADRMGLLPALTARGYRVDELRYHADTGRATARLSYRRIAKALDDRVFSIMRPDLEAVLRESLPPTVRQVFRSGVAGVADRPDGVLVTTASGDELTADLLVGADGIHSTVRRLVFGPEQDYLRYLGFHTAAFTFRDEMVRAEVAGGVCLTDSRDRQIGLYGLRDGRVAAFTVHRAADPTLPESPAAAVRTEYAPLGWVAPEVLTHVPSDSEVYYDQVAQIVMPSWTRGRVVLVGDAAHAVSLLAGQGASLAIGGAFVLADRLAANPTVDIGLAEYERAFRPEVAVRQRVALNAVRWFLPRTGTQLLLRRAALRVARIPVFTRYVAGAVTGKASGLVVAASKA